MSEAWLRLSAIAFVAVSFSAGDFAHGQSPATTPLAVKRELTLVGKPGTLDVLRKVPAASAFAAVVNETAGALVVAHAPQPTATKGMPADFAITDEPDLSVFKLDAQGEAGPATPIRLPRSAKLAARRHYPLALAAHPNLPLVYVWQDVVAPKEGSPPADQKTDGFKHLHVYDISDSAPRLVQSTAEGELFSRGNYAGAIALDRTASRLFVPNLQHRLKTGNFASLIGYLRLRDDGTVAEQAGIASKNGPVTAPFFGETPCGLGFHNLSDTVTIVCGGLGPVTWDESNRRAQMNAYSLYPAYGAGYRYRMIVHPTLPTVFCTALSSPYIYRVEHVDGFMTMFHQRATLANLAITSPPVIVGNRPYIAFQSLGFVHLVGFDSAGLYTGERTDIAVPSRKVEALAYSAKYDRLYATVEEAKK